MMRRTFLSVTIVLAFAAQAAAQDMPARAPERSVTTTGQATVRLVPDRAWVTVGIEARARKPQEAQSQAAAVMTAVQAQLTALGIPAAAIRTVSFNVQADWDYSNNRRTLRGYIVSNRIEVRVDDIAKVADVLDRSIAAGGNRIEGVRWDLQNRDTAERDALRRAVQDARQRAEVAVSAAGGKLGAVVRISEQRFDQRPPMPMMAARTAVVEEVSVETPISPGEIEIRSTVTVAFRIE